MEATETKADLARDLMRSGAIKFGGFRLKLHETQPDAPLSPIYIDLRGVCRDPDYNQDIAQAIDELYGNSSIECDVFADIPLSISPVVTLFANRELTRQVTPRPEAKTHGTDDMVIGRFERGEIALLIDDVITKAGSKLEAIETLKTAGLEVRDVLVIVDRQQGGKEELQGQGISLYSVFTLKELCDFYLAEGLIEQDQFDECARYFKWAA